MPELNMAEAKELLRNPRFVALWVAIWGSLVLAIGNVFAKIGMLMQLTQ